MKEITHASCFLIVGEVVEGFGHIHSPEYNGMECKILEGPIPLVMEGAPGSMIGVAYRVEWANGDVNLQAGDWWFRRVTPRKTYAGEQCVRSLFSNASGAAS